ncbi:MAG TPA: hypothetical protein VFZ65_16235 [Planctomycetota bacterium]|nr:hypothetical protein [Planctomycetota bacterium]
MQTTRCFSLLLAAVLGGPVLSQCNAVTTLTAGGTGQAGTMFDVVNISAGPIVVASFDQCFLNAGSSYMQIYTRAGTWNGFQNNGAAWTLVGSTFGLLAHGVAPALDHLPIAVNVTIPAGATQAFYITSDTSGTVAYTPGTNQVGTVIGSDAYVQVRCGIGISYPFGGAFGLPTDGRLWNGRINYCLQCGSLTTLTAAGSGQAGTMFDVVNVSPAPVNIASFDQCFLNAGSDNMFVYTKTGSWNGFQNNAAAWTLVASIPGVAHGIAPVLDHLPAAIDVTIPSGATQAFYITSDTSAAVAYTPGAGALGTVFASDAFLQVRCGVGMAYPFGTAFGLPSDGRKWNGRINHCQGNGPVLATNTNLGEGCISRYTTFYEDFATPAAFDLANSAITLTPNGGGGYTVQRSGSYLPVGATSTPIVLPLGDDASVTQALTAASFPGATGLTICSNGFVSLAPGNSNGYYPYVATLLDDPATSFRSWHDFNPAAPGSGQVEFEQSATAAVVTWDGVWDYGGTSAANANHMQMQFHPSGTVTIAWGQMSGLGNGHLVGYSPGGPSADPGGDDLSALGAGSIVLGATDMLPLTLTATTRAILNTNWSLTTSEIPATGAIGVDIFGLSDPGILDLAFLGLPTCQLRTALDQIQGPWFVSGASHTYGFFVPNNPSILSMHLYTQSAVFQIPPVNAFGAITSNGIDARVGNL